MRPTASETVCIFIEIILFHWDFMRLNGEVVSGMGEGKKFFLLEHYSRRFEKFLGGLPFAGTLNVDVGRNNGEKTRGVRENAQIKIEGFEYAGKKYFDVVCVRAKVAGVEGLIIFPHLNHHPPNILEFVCKEDMRLAHGLKNGDTVEIEF